MRTLQLAGISLVKRNIAQLLPQQNRLAVTFVGQIDIRPTRPLAEQIPFALGVAANH